MPDANSTAQLLQAIADRQQARIRDINALRVKSAAIPGNALSDAVGSFFEGRQAQNEQARSEEQHQLAQAQLQQLGVQNRKAEAEEALQEGSAGAGGKSRREAAADLALTGQQQTQDINAQQAKDSHTATMASLENAKAALSAQLRQGMDEHQNTLMTQYEHAVDNASLEAPGPGRDAKIAQIGTQYQKQGLPPSVVQGGAMRYKLTDMQSVATKAARDVAYWTATPEGRALQGSISSAQTDAAYHQQLIDAATKYQAALRIPGFDQGGSLNEKSPAADARREFAQLLASKGHSTEAQALLDSQTPWNTALDQMKESLRTSLPNAVNNWQTVGKSVADPTHTQPTINGVPNPEYKPEVGTVDAMYGNVNKQFQQLMGGSNAPTPGIDQINPLTLQPHSPRALSDAIKARKASSGQAGATAAPAPQAVAPPAGKGPVAQPVPPPQAPGMMAPPPAAAPAPQVPQVVLPENDPLLGQ